jgi:hypothetical protein
MKGLVQFVDDWTRASSRSDLFWQILYSILQERLADGERIIAYADRHGTNDSLEILLLTDYRLARMQVVDPMHLPTDFTWREVQRGRVQAARCEGSSHSKEGGQRCTVRVEKVGLLLPKGLSDREPPAAEWWSWKPRRVEHFREWEAALLLAGGLSSS